MTFILLSMLFMSISNTFADDPLKAGKEALQKGDLQTAISLLKDAVDKDKKNPEPYYWLGTALIKADSLDHAETILIQGRELNPNNAAVYMGMGDLYAKKRLTAVAIEQYKKAVELEPKNINYLIILAQAQKKNRQYNDASTTYQQALAFDSMNIPVLRELSSIYYRAKQYANAGVFLGKLVKLQPDSLNYQIMYVKALYETKNYPGLIPVADSLVKRDASLSDIQTMLAEAYQVTGQTKLVIEAYSKLNADSIKKIDDLVRYARALQSDQQYDKAEVIYFRAFHKDSTRCDLPYFIGTNEMSLKKYDAAVEMFDKKIACDTSTNFRYASNLNAAMCLMQSKNFKGARDHVKQALDYRPEDIKAWQTLAQCYGLMEQYADEVATYKKVIELASSANTNGDEGKYDKQLQEAYKMVGVRLLIDATKDKNPETNKAKYGNAAEYLKKALQLDPGDCPALLWLAQSYQNSNNKEEAIRYYKKILELKCAKQMEEAKHGLEVLGVK